MADFMFILGEYDRLFSIQEKTFDDQIRQKEKELAAAIDDRDRVQVWVIPYRAIVCLLGLKMVVVLYPVQRRVVLRPGNG